MENSLPRFARSRNYLWTDPHLARNMLAAHLDPEGDAASRNAATIRRTVEWIVTETRPRARLLDLGCGPGLYAEQLSARGYTVTGIDINPFSVEHARRSAQAKQLAIEYHNLDYLQDELPAHQEVALCIYCDFGALLPAEQARLLRKVYDALDDGGLLIFDVFGKGFSATCRAYRAWSYSDGPSFWCPEPHYLLEESVHFPDDHAWGRRSIVLAPGQEVREFITWDFYFSREALRTLLAQHGFVVEKIRTGLVARNAFTSNNVLFVKARKAGR